MGGIQYTPVCTASPCTRGNLVASPHPREGILTAAICSLAQESIATVTPEEFWGVAKPKVVGGAVLAAASDKGLALHELALFSSTSAVWSQSGACHYSAANSFLDGLATRNRLTTLWFTC